MAAEERRRHERFPIIVDCRIEGVSGGAAMRVTDISLGGCYVDTAIPFPDGANITVSVTLGETEVALSGRIIHTQPNHGFGVAIEFNDLKDPARRQLEAFLKQRDTLEQTAATLAEGLKRDDQRDDARHALRNFVDKIVIPPGTGLLQVVGNLGAMLEAAAGQKMPRRQAVGYVGCGGTQPSEFGVFLGCRVAVS